MRYLVAAALLSSACAATAPAPATCAKGQDYGLDVHLEGLSPSASYAIDVAVEGADVQLTMTPHARAMFVDHELADHRTLYVSLHDDTLRVLIAQPGVPDVGPDQLTVSITGDDGRSASHTFRPAYADEVPWTDGCEFVAASEELVVAA